MGSRQNLKFPLTKFVSVVTVTQQPVHDANIEGDDDVESGGGLESGHQALMWIVRRMRMLNIGGWRVGIRPPCGL